MINTKSVKNTDLLNLLNTTEVGPMNKESLENNPIVQPPMNATAIQKKLNSEYPSNELSTNLPTNTTMQYQDTSVPDGYTFTKPLIVPSEEDENYSYARYISILKNQRAIEYMAKYPDAFTDDGQLNATYPDISTCFGIYYTLSTGPTVLDTTTENQIMSNHSIYSLLVSYIDDTYEPIFILHTKGVTRIHPEDVKTRYSTLFDKQSSNSRKNNRSSNTYTNTNTFKDYKKLLVPITNGNNYTNKQTVSSTRKRR